MPLMRLPYVALILLTYYSCGIEGTGSQEGKLPFFDLSGYIQEATKDSSLILVEKSIVSDSSVEAKTIYDYPLWKDIGSFSSYDINRPALFDKYTIDTFEFGPRSEITSTAKDHSLQVQSQKVTYKNGVIIEIEIKTSSNSFLGNIDLEILWEPGKGYILHRRSDRIFGKESFQSITVQQK